MHRAFAGNVYELCALLVGERPGQLHIDVDPVEHAFLGLAVSAILSVNAVMTQGDGDILERDLFLARIQTNGHRRAGAESGEHVIVRVRRGFGAAEARWFVNPKAVFAGGDFLKETIRGAADDNVLKRRLGWGSGRDGCGHTPKNSQTVKTDEIVRSRLESSMNV